MVKKDLFDIVISEYIKLRELNTNVTLRYADIFLSYLLSGGHDSNRSKEYSKTLFSSVLKRDNLRNNELKHAKILMKEIIDLLKSFFYDDDIAMIEKDFNISIEINDENIYIKTENGYIYEIDTK
ncbi:MAG: hypothetical protein HQK96_13160 [Nitrospirae bacterium]|nr:hypothetical protein [Nitrospirota bacterium]